MYISTILIYNMTLLVLLNYKKNLKRHMYYPPK